MLRQIALSGRRGGRRAGRAGAIGFLGFLVVLAGSLALAPAAGAANAGVGMSVTPLFPPQVTVGQTNVAVALFITNASFGVGPVTLSTITLNPACADTSPGACASPDVGVFSLSGTGAGSTTGDACDGKSFTITGPNGNGTYTFTPGTPVVLAPTGSGLTSTCRIDFTVNVLHGPTGDADPEAGGIQTRQFATVVGSAVTTAEPISTLNGTGTGTSITTVKGHPSITTAVLSSSVTAGGQVQDTATISGLLSPTGNGTITFALYGPNDSSCEGNPVFTSVKPVNNGDGMYTSDAFTPTGTGTYRFVATYSGDTNNVSVANSCNDEGESVVVGSASPTLTTQISGPVSLGGLVRDTATLSGGTSPTGSITFRFYGPNNATCTGNPAFTSTVTVDHGNGQYTSAPFRPSATGSYTSVARYSGDNRNASVTTACIDAQETTSVRPRPSLTVTKTPSPSVMVVPGGTFTFTVVVTNTSTEAVTLASLVDDVYGDLNGLGTCHLGAVLTPNGGTYTCSFSGQFTSTIPKSQTDTVTARVVDIDGQSVSAIAQATVTLTAASATLGTSTALPATGRNVGDAFKLGAVVLVGLLWFRRSRRRAENA